MYTLGYDIGTRFVKLCLASDGILQDYEITSPGRDIGSSIRDARKKLLTRAGLHSYNIKNSAVTGFGCGFVETIKSKTDLQKCLAKAVYSVDSSARTVIDTGGLFINVVCLGNGGRITDSAENEKCAAGSGRFLETISKALEIPFNMISECVLSAENPLQITSNCSVFAESEVISRVNQGERAADILNGLLHSQVSKIETMLRILNGSGPVAMTGGVAGIKAFRDIFHEKTGMNGIELPFDPGITAAYGAALIAAENVPQHRSRY